VRALDRWGQELRDWALPAEILEAAPESPYGFDASLFRSRAGRSVAREPNPTTQRALETLPDGGSVLDVGVGGGATSLPLAVRAGTIIGVDGQADMLGEFSEAARRAGVASRAMQGAWPAVAPEAPAADVVVCGHALYNVQELEPFARALTAHARTRVVAEITEAHPWSWMGFLYERFHGLSRPDGPTADLAREALTELGFDVGMEPSESPPPGGFETRDAAIALVRRRLCLPAERDGEIAVALGDLLAEHDGLWSAGPDHGRTLTLWWSP